MCWCQRTLPAPRHRPPPIPTAIPGQLGPSQVGDAPEDIPLVEVEQHVVALELGLAGAGHAPAPQVLVHLLQALQALGHVLVVDLGVEGRHGLLTHEVSAVDVQPGTLLDQGHGRGVAQVLLRDVLAASKRDSYMRARGGATGTHSRQREAAPTVVPAPCIPQSSI